VAVVDHHVLNTSDIDATERVIEKVGATATVVSEMLENENVEITEEDATLLALGVHTDTGSLTYEVGRCRLPVSKPVPKAPMVSALEATL
jgi:tRNA nucleotidyltransferase (CCA-adding enzyme)